MTRRLFLNPEDFVACLARFRRIWKGGILQSGCSAAIKERPVQFFEFLFPPHKARPEVEVIFRIPYRGEGLPEDVPKTNPVDPVLSAAEDPLERGREGWVEIDTGRDFPIRGYVKVSQRVF